jgi:hypothetical protein
MANTLIMMKLGYQFEKAGSITAKDQGDGIVVVKHISSQSRIHKILVRPISYYKERANIR